MAGNQNFVSNSDLVSGSYTDSWSITNPIGDNATPTITAVTLTPQIDTSDLNRKQIKVAVTTDDQVTDINSIYIRIFSPTSESIDEYIVSLGRLGTTTKTDNTYEYIVSQPASPKHERRADGSVLKDAQGRPIMFDEGHDGKTLEDFRSEANTRLREQAGIHGREAEMSLCQVAVLRMFTYVFFEPWNLALRGKRKAKGGALVDDNGDGVLTGAEFKVAAEADAEKESGGFFSNLFGG